MFFVFLKKEKLDFVVFCFSLRDPTVILGITKHRIFSRGCGIEHLNPAPTGKKLDMDIRYKEGMKLQKELIQNINTWFGCSVLLR